MNTWHKGWACIGISLCAICLLRLFSLPLCELVASCGRTTGGAWGKPIAFQIPGVDKREVNVKRWF